MKNSIVQRTVISFYDEDDNLVGEEISKKFLRGKKRKEFNRG